MLKVKGIPFPFSGAPDQREPSSRGKDSDEIRCRNLTPLIEGYDKRISSASKIITEKQATADTLNTELQEVNKLVQFFHDAIK